MQQIVGAPYQEIVGADHFIVAEDAPAAGRPDGNYGPRVFQIKDRGPTLMTQGWVGFDSDENRQVSGVDSATGLVIAGQSARLVVTPQALFRGERLSIASDIAGFFVINDIQIGTVTQLPAVKNAPARSFTEFATISNIFLQTAQISQEIALVVRNISGVNQRFLATLYGWRSI